MLKIDPHKLQTALLPKDTPMFGDVIAQIALDETLPKDRRRDIMSGLRRVAKVLGRPPEDIPADPHWLQQRLQDILPASLGLTAKSWSNILSNARAGLIGFGVVSRRHNRKQDLLPAWQQIWAIVLASRDPTLPKGLSRFVYFLSNLGVQPEEVCYEHAEAFLTSMEQNELRRSPDRGFRIAVNAWNLAAERFSQWPRQTFTLPSRAKVIKLKITAFPPSFATDLERYLSQLSAPDIFDPDALAEPLRPSSIFQYRSMLQRFASILVHAGLPVEEICGLSDLVAIAKLETGLRWMLQQNGNKTTPGTADTINLLRNVARRYVKVGEQDQRRIDQLQDRLSIKDQVGMTAKNRERLRPLDDKETLRRLLRLPERLFEGSFGLGDTKAAAAAREDAVAIAILLYCPVRRKNLFEIAMEQNLERPGDGRVFLAFTEDEVKNRRRIEFQLPEHVVAMIDRHLKTRAPRLCPAGTPWLFPRRDGSAAADPDYFGGKVKKRIGKELGLTFNMHLFRHLAAKIWLEAKPGQYEVARRLMGHSALSQTLNVYAGFEAGTSTRLFAEVVNAERRA